jgi:hypothetical protein
MLRDITPSYEETKNLLNRFLKIDDDEDDSSSKKKNKKDKKKKKKGKGDM